MTRILVVQLCRLGDILQTTPMLRGLRRRWPDGHVTLLLLDGFAHTPVPPHLADRVLAFPFDAIAPMVRGAAPRWRDAAAAIGRTLDDLGADPFDLVFNVTGSPLSNLLVAAIPSRDVQGGAVAPDRTRVVHGAWMTYFWASQTARALGGVNLVDLFLRMAGLPSDRGALEIAVPEAAERTAAAWLAERHPAGRPLLAVQLGASDERKRWPPERFAAMLDRMPVEWGTPLFVGTASERPLLERARAALGRPLLDALGATSVPELAAMLRRCRVLVTNDTGTMHVAAAAGTRIVDLSTGPVFVHETGPYGEGHLAVEPGAACFPCVAGAECRHMSCRDDFSPDDIASVVGFALGERRRPRLPRARLLQSRFSSDGRLEYRTVGEPAGHDERLRLALSRMWVETLPRPSAVPVPEEAVEPLDDATALAGALEGMAADADRAAALAGRIPRATPAAQQELSHAISEAMGRIALAGQLEPACLAIGAYLRTAVESCTARDVPDVARVYARELTMAAGRARRVRDLVVGAAAGAAGRRAS